MTINRSKKSFWLRHNWSTEERDAFNRALRKGDDFQPGGLAEHWSPRTVGHAELAWGRFRQFCIEAGWLGESFEGFSPLFQLEKLRLYYWSLKPNLAPVTVLKWMTDLGLAVRVMAPEIDRRDYKRVLAKIGARAVRVRKIKENLVAPDESVKLANKLMSSAESASFQGKRAALKFRNGCLVLAFALVPLRRKEWQQVNIGQELDLGTTPAQLRFKAGQLKVKSKAREEPLPLDLDAALRG